MAASSSMCLFDKPFEIEHHARAALRVGGGPAWKSGERGFHRLAHFGAACEWRLGLNLAGGGVEHVTEAAALALDPLAVDEMAEFFHETPPGAVFRPLSPWL